jgi:hypothetical protein
MEGDAISPNPTKFDPTPTCVTTPHGPGIESGVLDSPRYARRHVKVCDSSAPACVFFWRSMADDRTLRLHWIMLLLLPNSRALQKDRRMDRPGIEVNFRSMFGPSSCVHIENSVERRDES